MKRRSRAQTDARRGQAMRRGATTRTGSTLVEVLIALAILALVVVCVFTTSSKASLAASSARQQFLAARVAEEVLAARELAGRSEKQFEDRGAVAGWHWVIESIGTRSVGGTELQEYALRVTKSESLGRESSRTFHWMERSDVRAP